MAKLNMGTIVRLDRKNIGTITITACTILMTKCYECVVMFMLSHIKTIVKISGKVI